MEIQDKNSVIFFTSRVFGLAPYLVERSLKGQVQAVKLSLILCGYSVLLLATMSGCDFLVEDTI